MEKVSEIEFHCNSMYECDDLVVRMADLIKEGYRIVKVYEDPKVMSCNSMNTEPFLHITLRKPYNFEKY